MMQVLAFDIIKYLMVGLDVEIALKLPKSLSTSHGFDNANVLILGFTTQYASITFKRSVPHLIPSYIWIKYYMCCFEYIHMHPLAQWSRFKNGSVLSFCLL